MSLHVGSHGSAVTSLQKDLLKLHLLNHAATGKFDTATRDAVKHYERQHHLAQDGFVPAWEAVSIHKAAAHTAAANAHPNAAPPPGDYHHVLFRGHTVNVRTRSMVLTAEAYMHRLGVPGKLEIGQGSFHHNPTSGTTHDGGGAIDVRVLNYSSRQRHLVVKALRMAGFAAWNRYPAEGFANHIHAIAIGDKTMSAGARFQVHEYFRGRSGLSRGGSDVDGPYVGRPYPRWAAKYA
jgi:peptidoglycan hydrolase-like protein with peptidoglycan-binding domain